MAETITLGGDKTTKTTTGTYLQEGNRKWYFDIITREEITTQTRTTDHYLENGCLVQDHAVDMPIYYTLTGYVGEKVHIYSGEPNAEQYVKRVQLQDTLRRWQTLGQVAPTLSSYVYSAINAGRFIAGRITQIIKAGQSIFRTTKVTDKIRDLYEKLPETVTGIYGSSKYELDKINRESLPSGVVNRFITKRQKLLYLNFERLRRTHEILTLYTPWGEIQKVIIEEIRFNQDKYWSMSGATITVKQLNFTDAVEEKGSNNPFDPETQRKDKVENGNVKTKPVDDFEAMKDKDGFYYINGNGERIDIK